MVEKGVEPEEEEKEVAFRWFPPALKTNFPFQDGTCWKLK